MSKWIHNLTSDEKEYQGRPIAANSYFQIPDNLLVEYRNDLVLLADLVSGAVKMSANGSSDLVGSGSAHIDFLKDVDPTPRDSTGRPITRRAITNDGWHYQLHQLEFTTAKLNSIYNKDENGNDLGFGTIKLFKEDGSEITDQAEENLAVKTQVDWMTNHEMDIIGGQLYQAAPPAQDCRLWIIAAPGILNLRFGQGGINLKHAPAGGAVNADGRASKYLPPSPAGINKFRLIFKHPAGFNHNAMMLFELFKP